MIAKLMLGLKFGGFVAAALILATLLFGGAAYGASRVGPDDWGIGRYLLGVIITFHFLVIIWAIYSNQKDERKIKQMEEPWPKKLNLVSSESKVGQP